MIRIARAEPELSNDATADQRPGAIRPTPSPSWLARDAGSTCCLGLSIPGIVFLTIVGILFDRQPLYTSTEVEDAAAAASDCYFAGERLVGAVVLVALSKGPVTASSCGCPYDVSSYSAG